MSPIINFNNLLKKADLLQIIIDDVTCGGSLVNLSKTWDVRFCDIQRWINDDPDRKRQYIQATNDRAEWATQRILKEMHDIAFRNVASIYNDDHTLKPVKEWPADVVACIDEIEVTELFNEFGKPIGKAKKSKFVQKIKALELLGKNHFMFVERKQVMHGDSTDSEFRDNFFGVGKKQQGSPTTGATQII